MAILSINDNTEVDVKINTSILYNRHPYSNGSTIRISLDKLEAVQLTSSKDFSGSTVHSNKPVAVLSGNPCEGGYSYFCNYLVEYLPPNRACGQYFIVPPFNGSSSSLRIFSTNDRAELSITGTSKTTTNISVTNTHHIERKLDVGEAYAIRSDHTVCVYVLLIKGTSPMLTAIPSFDQYVDHAVVPMPTIEPYENFLSIVTESSSLSELHIDNQILSPSNLKTINLDGTEYSAFWVHLDSNASIHRLSGASNDFVAISYGYNKDGSHLGETYGYPVGWNFDYIK